MESLSIIDPFDNVSSPASQAAGTAFASGDNSLSSLTNVSIGSGNRVLHADQSGLWLGAQRFTDAVFSVDMQGNVNIKGVGAGTAGIFISGPNKNIIVNDGSNDRVLLGFQSGGF